MVGTRCGIEYGFALPIWFLSRGLVFWWWYFKFLWSRGEDGSPPETPSSENALKTKSFFSFYFFLFLINAPELNPAKTFFQDLALFSSINLSDATYKGVALCALAQLLYKSRQIH
jgi:hypothetical protein